MANLVFETTVKEVPVTIDGKSYMLRELNGQGTSEWRKSTGGDVSFVDGKATITNIRMEDPEVRLLSLCLYNEKNELVTYGVIKMWPQTVLSGLYNAAQELSGLNEEARNKLKAEAKNS